MTLMCVDKIDEVLKFASLLAPVSCCSCVGSMLMRIKRIVWCMSVSKMKLHSVGGFRLAQRYISK